MLWEDGVVGIPLGGFDSHARDINDVGDIVGDSKVDVGGFYISQAALWEEHSEGHSLINLGTLGGRSSRAHAINNRGSIVGTASDFEGKSQAMIYENGVMSNLNDFIEDSDWHLNVAYDINDHGWIVGTGTYGGQRAGFLLVPVSAVPEPSALFMVASTSLLAFLRVSLRRDRRLQPCRT